MTGSQTQPLKGIQHPHHCQAYSTSLLCPVRCKYLMQRIPKWQFWVWSCFQSKYLLEIEPSFTFQGFEYLKENCSWQKIGMDQNKEPLKVVIFHQARLVANTSSLSLSSLSSASSLSSLLMSTLLMLSWIFWCRQRYCRQITAWHETRVLFDKSQPKSQSCKTNKKWP